MKRRAARLKLPNGRPVRKAWAFNWLLVLALCLVATSAVAASGNYAGKNLTGRSFKNQKLRKANFRVARLNSVDFEKADLAQAVFYGASGSSTKFRGAKLGGANFHGSTFNQSSFVGAVLHGSDFIGATIGSGDFRGADLRLVRAKGANFQKSRFDAAKLTSAKFPGADLKHTSFVDADLRSVDFTGADLRHANLCNAKIDKRTNFRGADTRGASCYSRLVGGAAPAPGRWVVTRFRSKNHGYPFRNSFNNDVISGIDVRTAGLCGGMSFSALDYFKKGYPIPGRDYRPATHTKIHDYIYKRQVASLKNDVARWAELKADPTFGLRNKEFFNWGLQGFGGGRLQELRAKIDRGEPAPLGLAAYGSTGPGDHQVVAIGYNLGRYKGDLKAHKEDLRIRIYDPNHPGKELTLVPDVAAQKYYYLEHPKEYWRTYFVANYNRVTPPRIRDATYRKDGKVHELIIRFLTGGDDLRKGSKFDLEIKLRDGVKRFANVNRGRRWLGNYDQTVAFPLGKGVAASDILSVTIKTAFGGGASGDNWNLDAIVVHGFQDNAQTDIYPASGTTAPKVRFTGSKRQHTYTLNRPTTRKSRRRRPPRRRPRRRKRPRRK